MSQELNNPFIRAFDMLFGGKNSRDMSCRKMDVVAAVIEHPDWDDDKIAEKIRCSSKTVKKWRGLSSCGMSVKAIDGSYSYTVRLKNDHH